MVICDLPAHQTLQWFVDSSLFFPSSPFCATAGSAVWAASLCHNTELVMRKTFFRALTIPVTVLKCLQACLPAKVPETCICEMLVLDSGAGCSIAWSNDVVSYCTLLVTTVTCGT